MVRITLYYCTLGLIKQKRSQFSLYIYENYGSEIQLLVKNHITNRQNVILVIFIELRWTLTLVFLNL